MKKLGTVIAVACSPEHDFSKQPVPVIELIEGIGVNGDAHAGARVKHRSRVKADPDQPNLRQVHLVHSELFDELREQGFVLAPGEIGENVTTRGVDLLRLPRGTRLRLGPSACVELTGLRNPCFQLNKYQQGLMEAVIGRDAHGRLSFKAGIMAVVVAGGHVRAGDPIRIELPPGPHEKLERV